MTSLAAVRLAAQRPRWSHLPPDVKSSSGADAADLAASAGLHLYDWQRWWLDNALSERTDGQWCARENVLITGRQSGKNGCLAALELFYLFTLGDPLVIHSAHELPTAVKHFNYLLELIDGCPDLSRKCRKPTKTHGQESINVRARPAVFVGGRKIPARPAAVLQIRARGINSGRGLTAARLVFDEAFKIDPQTMGALIPTMRAMPNRQVTYSSSAPKADSAVLHGLIARGRKDDSADRLFYAEWGNPIGTAMDDVDAWYEANPSLGVVKANGEIAIEEETLHDEYRTLVSGGNAELLAEFAREAVGIGELPLGTEARPVKLPAAAWAATVGPDLPANESPTVLTFDVSRDGEWSTVAIGAGTMSSPYVEVIAHRQGVGWLPTFIADKVRSIGPVVVGVNGAGPAGAQVGPVLAAFAEADPPIPADLLKQLSTTEYKQACGGFYTDVTEGRLRRPDQGADGKRSPLDIAAADATERPLGDAWAWDFRNATVPISPLVAVTVARSLLPVKDTTTPLRPLFKFS